MLAMPRGAKCDNLNFRYMMSGKAANMDKPASLTTKLRIVVNHYRAGFTVVTRVPQGDEAAVLTTSCIAETFSLTQKGDIPCWRPAES